MKMKKKPTEPKRRKNVVIKYPEENDKILLSEVVSWANKNGYNFEDIVINLFSTGYGYFVPSISVHKEESEKTYQKRVDKYLKNLADYKSWVLETEKELKKELTELENVEISELKVKKTNNNKKIKNTLNGRGLEI